MHRLILFSLLAGLMTPMMPSVAFAGPNWNGRLVLHAGPLDLSCLTGVTCDDWGTGPVNTVSPGPHAIYLLAQQHNDLVAVQTAFDWQDWTVTASFFECQPGQVTTRVPSGPGPVDGTLTTSFDALAGGGGPAVVLGFLTTTATCGELRQVDSGFPDGTHMRSATGDVDPVPGGSRGSVRVDGPGVDACGYFCNAGPIPECTSDLYPYFDAYFFGNADGGSALGDLDGDNHTDLVTSIEGYLTVMLGHGDGSFGEASFEGAGFGVPALGHLDGDQSLDLAIGYQGGLGVLLGVGNGEFGSPTVFPSPQSISQLRLVDVNGDEELDVVALVGGFGGDLVVLIGGGDGTFGSPTVYAVGPNPLGLAVGDVNGDQAPDVAVVNDDQIATDDIKILLNAGNGTFQAGTFTDDLVGPEGAIALGDVDGDEILDLVVGDTAGDLGHWFNVYLGVGNGTFTEIGFHDTIRCPDRAAIRDFDGDGSADVLIHARGNCTSHAFCHGTSLRIHAGNGDGTFAFTAYHYCDLGESGASEVAIGDLDGDSIPDLVAGADGRIVVNHSTESTAVDPQSSPPRPVAMRAVPNPFGHSTEIVFAVPVAGPVGLSIYDVGGRLVRRLFDAPFFAAGEHRVRWDGRDRYGAAAASGVYVSRLELGGGQRIEQKLLHLR